MEELNIEQFNPTVAELTALADGYKDLAITGPDDKEGYQRVHKARLDLRNCRVTITKQGKALRDKANAFNKAVIAKENELVAIVEPVEIALKERQEAVDLEIEKRKRLALLPERKEKMASIEADYTDEHLLSLDPEQFSAYFNAEKEAYLNRKEAALNAEKERQEAEKRQAEEAKLAEARKAEEAKLEAEREAQRQLEIEKAKTEAAEAEKERIRLEYAERVDRENKEAAEKAEREAKEQAELEGKKRYQAFLKKHGVHEGTIGAGAHIVKREGNQVMLYQLVDTLTL